MGDILIPSFAATCTIALTYIGAQATWMRERPGLRLVFIAIGALAIFAIAWQGKRNHTAATKAELARQKAEADSAAFTEKQDRLHGELESAHAEIGRLTTRVKDLEHQLQESHDKLADKNEESRSTSKRSRPAAPTKAGSWSHCEPCRTSWPSSPCWHGDCCYCARYTAGKVTGGPTTSLALTSSKHLASA